jgi:hypothetical protein
MRSFQTLDNEHPDLRTMRHSLDLGVTRTAEISQLLTGWSWQLPSRAVLKHSRHRLWEASAELSLTAPSGERGVIIVLAKM